MKRKRLQFIAIGIAVIALGHLYPLAKRHYRMAKVNQQRVNLTAPDSAVDSSNFSEAKKHGAYLCYGQSNASNFGQVREHSFPGVFQVCEEAILPYSEPSCGTGGNGGNPWGNLGCQLIKTEIHASVTFANASVGGASLLHLTQPEYFDYFVLQYNRLKSLTGHVDAILFFQGEGDYGKSEHYASTFAQMMRQLEIHQMDAPFIVSQTSICASHIPDDDLLQAQLNTARVYPNVLLGPNTDSINFPGDRYDNCHFTSQGLDRLSQLWLETIESNLN